MKKAKWLYPLLFFGICLVPTAGTLVKREETSSENRTLAEFPSLKTEEGWNLEWLEDAGDYFQEHFALRSELVTADALLYGKALGTSTADGVIQGTDGWLYYKDSLADYQGTEQMSERSLYNLSHSLALMQAYAKSKGTTFLFAAAPNKNSLYGEHMPYYYRYQVSGEKNLDRLEGYLQEEGVSYVNLCERFQNEEETLYHKRDSHWTNKGAALASGWILDAFGKDHTDWETEAYTVRTDFEGDLDTMLYPLAVTPEEEVYYERKFTYSYTQEIESTFDPKIYTENAGKEGSLVVYRDSFGNALLPFLAEEYGTAYFSRGVPYYLTDLEERQADAVLVIRAERFLSEMAQSPPVMEAPEVSLEGDISREAEDGASDVTLQTTGAWAALSGRIQEDYLDTRTRIFIRFADGTAYEASPRDVELEDGSVDPGGFVLYLPAEQISGEELQAEIICETNERAVSIYQNAIREDENET